MSGAGGTSYNDWGSTWKGCLFKGSGIWKGRQGCRYNREEKSLCHVAMVAKFLDETNRLSHFKVYSHYFKLHWSDLGETFLGPYILLSKFRKIKQQFFFVFTYSLKQACEIRKFHVVVVKQWQRNVQNSILLFVNINILFCAILLAVTVIVGFVVIQKKCHHGNMMSHFSSLLYS